MKLSFSNNGWDLSFKELLEFASKYKVPGIEIHDPHQACFKEENPFGSKNVERTKAMLGDHQLSISCIDVIANIADNKKEIKAISEILNAIKIASKVGCSYVRIRAFKISFGMDDQIDEQVIEIVKKVLPRAKEKNVTILIESMGVYSDTNRLKNILDYFNDNNIAALWDVSHTINFGNETPAKSIMNLGAYIKHVHIKDIKKVEGRFKYALMGEGELPFKLIFEALRSIDYRNYLSIEIKLHNLEDKDAHKLLKSAIALTEEFNKEAIHEKCVENRGELFYSNRKNGRYIWEKEKLINYTFPQVLDRMCEEFPNQIAFDYLECDYKRTYVEFRNDVDTFARALIHLGVKPGDHVTIWATNVPEWYITFWATIKIGAVLVAANTAYKSHEAEFLLRQSDTHTVVITQGYRDSDYAGIINELCPELANNEKGQELHAKKLPFLRNVITVGFNMPGCYSFDEAMKLSKNVDINEVYKRAANIDVHDVCNMQYTSGTTGFPKGVMLTHFNVVNNGKNIGDRMDLSTEDRMMIQVPMFHCFGMVLAMTAAITHGVSLYPLSTFRAKNSLKCVNDKKITCFHGVPTMFIAMLNHEDFAVTDFSHVRTGIMAGSPCPVPVMNEVLNKMNMKEITIVYGQTEASPGCTMSSTQDSVEVRVETVGGPLPCIECDVVNPETNEKVGDNVVGEFVARGYNIMKGYYKLPEETAKVIDSEGWLHTGDLTLRRPDGNYKITGRLKDMIIRGGENLYPKEIEDFIYTHPKVKDVQVVGVPDEKYGEEAYAFVISQEGSELTEEELREYMSTRIAKHKIPRYFEFTDAFPMNVAGKILKYKMREDALARIQGKR